MRVECGENVDGHVANLLVAMEETESDRKESSSKRREASKELQSRAC